MFDEEKLAILLTSSSLKENTVKQVKQCHFHF